MATSSPGRTDAPSNVESGTSELRILSSIALKPVFELLTRKLEDACGLRLATRLLASPTVQREINDGAAFDVAISNPSIVDEMIHYGHVTRETRVNIVRSNVGVVGRIGAPKRDVSTIECFKHTLRSASSIAHSDGGVGRLFLGMLDQLAMREELSGKLKAVPAYSGAEVVSRGEAEIAILVTVAIPGVQGVELIGLPPAELRPYIEFSGAVGASSTKSKAAAALLSCLTAQENDTIIRSVGMSRIPASAVT
jgi:molybdate transport system substrate-binding protein